MKKILKQIFFLSMLAALFASCKKDEHKIFFNGGTNPVLTSSVTSANLPLSFDTKDNIGLMLSWTNPDYKFTTGISSQDVSYQVEIDTTGSNFTSSKRQIISVSKNLSLTMTQSVLNDYLLNQLQLVPGVEHQLEIRVTSFLINSSEPLRSNVLKYTVTPYAIPPKVTPPTTGTLFIVGSATPGGSAHGWDNPITQPVAAQQFTQVSNTVYTITIPLIGGGEYKFIAVNGNWTQQWSIAKNDDPDMVTGGDLVFNGANILAPAASGNYKIEVDFQRGKFSVTKL
ncbi:MAG TPA: SusE domain-containing protein [Hanamia sp.]|nr:SusE domain-containing protein [Hanamia sp.]